MPPTMTEAISLLRRSTILAVVVTCLAYLATDAADAAPLVLTGNYKGDSVSVINAQTNKILGDPIEVGEGPSSIAVTPNGRFAYVTNYTSGNVSVIDTAAREVVGEPIETGEGPEVIAIAPDGKTAYVCDRGTVEITVIDTETNKAVGTIPLSGEPSGLAFSPDGTFAYVANLDENAVEVIDTAREEVVGEPIPVGEEPEMVTFSPDGKTAYVSDYDGAEVSAIDTATQKVTSIPVGSEPWGIAVTPDGAKAFVTDYGDDAISVIDTATSEVVEEIPTGEEPYEIAITPDGKTAYVADYEAEDVRGFDTQTYKEVADPIEVPGLGPWQVAISPDRSPVAAFAVPDITAGVAATFSGAGSTDVDGTVASYAWTFGDGGTASGPSPSHTYSGPGTYNAKLSVVDDQGCGEEEVFTGRTAYCSGGKSSVVHQVTAKAPASPIVRSPSNKFRFGRVLHNRRNGTARLQVKLPGAGYVFLFGKKVHAITRKSKAAGSMWLTIHARVELNKRLKQIHRTPVRIRITFTPNGGAPKTVHRTIVLLRAPRKTHSRN
jgi:YVTN family beta-propeller protein